MLKTKLSAAIGLFVVILLYSSNAFSWGKIGHRIVGQLAEHHLNAKAKLGIKRILGTEDLAQASTWPDEIKSLREHDKAIPWHYVSIPNEKTYFDQKRNSDGDIIEALYRFEEILREAVNNKKTKTSLEERKQALRFIVHLVGDLHQPLHVGLAEDRGGNLVRVKWFKEESNLHALWDEGLIIFEQLSYTEYSARLNHYTDAEKKELMQGDFLAWAKESQELRGLVYNLGKSDNLSYEYHFNVKPVYELRLKKAGLRLASVLNKVFTNEPHSEEFKKWRQKVRSNI